MKGPQRHIIVEGLDKCFCSRCDEYHDCIEFHRDRRTPTGWSYNCVATAKKYGVTESQQTFLRETKEGSDEVLKALGYDPTSPIPVHQQFLIKHDL
jgi:hypothetical protein